MQSPVGIGFASGKVISWQVHCALAKEVLAGLQVHTVLILPISILSLSIGELILTSPLKAD